MASPGPLRIASASGSVTDRRHSLTELARDEDVQFIVGDWMSEYNMTTRGGSKVDSAGSSEEFEISFLEALEPGLKYLASGKKKKLIVNAGASDTEKLCKVVTDMVKAAGVKLKVAWIGGDEVFDAVEKAYKSGAEFASLTTDTNLADWKLEPIYAQCYLGSWGIVEALKYGADIILCGRVADACPTIGAAAFHFGWGRENLDELASAFVAGHLIECGTYVTGGNFTGFKSFSDQSIDLGFPVIEFGSNGNGEFTVGMQKGKDGTVSVGTCSSQLLYEIQGPLYYNSDVVARLDGIKMRELKKNLVHVSGIKGLQPPSTTKVGITAKGGYQAEVHYFLVGLDIEEKAALLERQVRAVLDESKFHCLKFRINGRCPADPQDQDSATVDLRVFAQARKEEDISVNKFFRPVTDNIMQTYPGATFAVDTRQGVPQPYYEYYVSLLPQSEVKHVCYVPEDGIEVSIPPPTDTADFIRDQETYNTANPIDLASPALGPTTRAPLGYIVHARSGDKGSDANVGFFVRNADEYDWLRTILSVEKVRELLAKEDKGKPIFRFELPHINAVHFLLKDHLDRGVASSSTYDVLGKNVAEYLRCKTVEIPNKFLERGKI